MREREDGRERTQGQKEKACHRFNGITEWKVRAERKSYEKRMSLAVRRQDKIVMSIWVKTKKNPVSGEREMRREFTRTSVGSSSCQS